MKTDLSKNLQSSTLKERSRTQGLLFLGKRSSVGTLHEYYRGERAHSRCAHKPITLPLDFLYIKVSLSIHDMNVNSGILLERDHSYYNVL